MQRPPPRSTRTDTLFPYTTLVRSIRNDMHFKLAFRLRPGIAPFGVEIAVSEDVDIRGEAERGSLTGASMFVLPRIDALADKLREAISLITCGCGRPGAAQFPEGRSDERRVGKECVRTCRSRWSPE